MVELVETNSQTVELAPVESVLAQVARREPESLNCCIERYGNLIWSLAKRYSPTQVDAEDAVQEIFFEIWQKADRFDSSRSAESTFVTMIARRRLIDRFRKQARSIATSSHEMDFNEQPDQSGSRSIEVIDEAAKATRCLEGLVPNQKDILRRSIHEGKSHSQISMELQMPLGSVKSFARRGLIQLRECMEKFSVAGTGAAS
jgi:RNA polymerase sigma factor (sigma-70 family)